MNWENIDKLTDRAKVHKGWLVRVWSNDCSRMSICFVPDPMWAWKL